MLQPEDAIIHKLIYACISTHQSKQIPPLEATAKKEKRESLPARNCVLMMNCLIKIHEEKFPDNF